MYSQNSYPLSIYFFTKKEAQEFIWDDNDNYIKNMSKSDLIARQYSKGNTNDYKNICVSIFQQENYIFSK